MNFKDIDYQLKQAIGIGDKEKIVSLMSLLPENFDYVFYSNIANIKHKNDIVKMLYPLVEDRHRKNMLLQAIDDQDFDLIDFCIDSLKFFKIDTYPAFKYAAMRGYENIARSLLPYTSIPSDDYPLLGAVAEQGLVEIVDMLIKFIDPKGHEGLALRWAVEANEIKVVQQLIPYCNKPIYNIALCCAVETNNKEIIDILFDISDIKKVEEMLADIQTSNKSKIKTSYFYNKLNSSRDKKILKENIDMSSKLKPGRVKKI